MPPHLAVPLAGSIVVLEPLEARHREGLFEAAQHAEIWSWLPHVGQSRERFDEWFEEGLAESAAGREGAFATIDSDSGDPIGSSRYLNVRLSECRLEIGWTWLTPTAWRTGANVEAKLLMLGHAFAALGCQRVEFKTDARNERSRAALGALPAQFEGVMRKHMVVPDIGTRDSAYFSVIDDEWPQVRENLERRLATAGAGRSPG